jgi:GGDEF domain-containing protein
LHDLGDGMCTKNRASVGVALAPEHGTDVAILVAVADATLYEAKSGGKLRCRMGLTDAVAGGCASCKARPRRCE